jgi:hypothetical protein
LREHAGTETCGCSLKAICSSLREHAGTETCGCSLKAICSSLREHAGTEKCVPLKGVTELSVEDILNMLNVSDPKHNVEAESGTGVVCGRCNQMSQRKQLAELRTKCESLGLKPSKDLETMRLRIQAHDHPENLIDIGASNVEPSQSLRGLLVKWVNSTIQETVGSRNI